MTAWTHLETPHAITLISNGMPTMFSLNQVAADIAGAPNMGRCFAASETPASNQMPVTKRTVTKKTVTKGMRTTACFLLVLSLCAAPSVQGQTLATVRSSEVQAEMFDAWQKNLIDVRYVAINATRGNLLIENLQAQTLLISLPDAFAAKPVLGQFGLGQNGGTGVQGGGGAQNVGGNAQRGIQGGAQGLGNGGLGNAGNQPGGFMRIPPGSTMRRTTVTVCLNHGLADPRPSMDYRVVPIAEATDDPVISQLCTRLGTDAFDNHTVQAAVWNRANGVAWDKLASMPAHRSRYLPPRPLFSPDQLSRARLIIDGCVMAPETVETEASAHSARSDAQRVLCTFPAGSHGG